MYISKQHFKDLPDAPQEMCRIHVQYFWHGTISSKRNPLPAPCSVGMCSFSHQDNTRYLELFSLPLILFLFFSSQCETQSSPYPATGLISLSSLILSCYPSLKTNSSHSAPLQLLSACWQRAACELCCHFTSGGKSFEGIWSESWYLFTIEKEKSPTEQITARS